MDPTSRPHPNIGHTRATVREFDAEGGWGVLDSSQTPGGCWVHYSAIATGPGFRMLAAGAHVELDWEALPQDGYRFRARRVWPVGTDPIDPPTRTFSGAYTTTLDISFDDDIS